jgi:caa(3)-type oxidase subunit IV
MSTHADPSHIDPVTGDYVGPMFDDHDKMYLKVAAALFVLTGIEVALSYSGLEHGSLAGMLLALAAIKFIVVAGFFMHLKFDTPMFRRLFIGGAVLAGFCYTAVLSATGALRTPRAILPIHWWVYLVFAVAVLGVWVVPHGGDHDDELALDDHTGHAHAH